LSPSTQNCQIEQGFIRLITLQITWIFPSAQLYFTCHCKLNQNGASEIHTRVHSSDKLFKCTLCDYSCKNSGYLNRHIRTHTGETPYPCRLCEYQAKTRSDLTSHKRIRSGIKPYKCQECDYTTAYPSALKRHQKIHLPNPASPSYCRQSNPSFDCKFPLCNFKTRDNKDLAFHLHAHSLPQVILKRI